MTAEKWHVKRFADLSGKEVYELLRARETVFVVEQECAYHEIDHHDLESLHVYTTDAFGVVTAYARIFQEGGLVTFGRVLVRKDQRGKGLANQLIGKVLQVIEEHFPKQPIEIEAQEYVQALYARFGFKTISDVFLLDDIPHVRMEKR